MQFARHDDVHEGNVAFSHAQGGDVDTRRSSGPGCCLCATSMERSICVISRVGEIPRVSLILFNERARPRSTCGKSHASVSDLHRPWLRLFPLDVLALRESVNARYHNLNETRALR